MAWQEVRKGRGKGGSGLQASLAAMQNSMAQLAASIQHTYNPQGKGGPGEGSTKTWRERQWEWEGRGAQGGKPPTLLREGYTYHGGDSMHRLPTLQLDNPQCMQILRPEIAPGALHCENGTTVPGTGAEQPGCTFLLLCGILWFVLRQCCQRIPRARPTEKKRTRPS